MPYRCGVSTLACPVCGTEYESWSTRCTQCGVALVATHDDENPLTLDDEDKVVYELAEWPLDLQAATAQAMAESGVPHAWEATDLVVHVDFEAQVDALLAELEEEAGLPGARDTDTEAEAGAEEDEEEAEEGEPAQGDEVVYELDEWTDDQRRTLAVRLDGAGVPYAWEGSSTLVVSAVDEDLVEEVLDELEYPDALEVEAVSAEEEAAEEASAEQLSSLFVAADRLKGDPGDASGLADLVAATEAADENAPPYGFPPQVWKAAVAMARELTDLLAAEEDRSDEAEEKARELRDLLRPYV